MGMLLVDPFFAERILEKYSFPESYYFDADELVFYKESPAVSGEASSAYNTELTLKLLLMFQNYEQSGQRLSVSWNLLHQTVLRQARQLTVRAAAPVLEAVKILESRRDALRELETVLRQRQAAVERDAAGTAAAVTPQLLRTADLAAEREALRIFRQAEAHMAPENRNQLEQQVSELTWVRELLRFTRRREIETAKTAPLYRLLRTAGAMERLERLLQTDEAAKPQSRTEETSEVLRRILTGTGMPEEKERRLLKLLGTETVRGRILQESQAQVSRMELLTETQRQSLHQLMEEAWLESGPAAVRAAAEPGEAAVREMPREMAAQSGRETLRQAAVQTLRTYTRELTREQLQWMGVRRGPENVRLLNGIGGARMLLQARRIQEQALRPEHMEAWLGFLTEPESRTVRQELLTALKSWVPSAGEPEAAAVWNTVAELVYRTGESAARLASSAEPETGSEAAGREVLRQLVRREPEAMARLMIYVLRERESGRMPQTRALFQKYESQVFRQAERESTRERIRRLQEELQIPEAGAESGAGRQQNWETMSLTARMLAILESRFRDPSQARQAERELAEILVRDFHVEERQLIFRELEEGISQQEKQRQAETFLQFLKAPMAARELERRIEASQVRSRRRLEAWVRTYQHLVVTERIREMERTRSQQQTLVLQVRSRLGEGAARQLEAYFEARRQTAVSAADTRSLAQMEQAARLVMRSYLAAAQNETAVSAMGDGSELYLHNQVRARVHQPLSREFPAVRRQTETVTRMIRRNYWFQREQTILAERVRRQLGESAAEAVLRGSGPAVPEERAGETAAMALRESRRPGALGEEIVRRVQAQGSRLAAGYESGREGEAGTPFDGYRRIRVESGGSKAAADRNLAPAAPSAGRYQLEEARTEFLRRQRHTETEMEETRTVVKRLNEKLEIQQKLMVELQKKTSGPQPIPPQISVSQLTRQVMKRMEEELRTEKMRRGIL